MHSNDPLSKILATVNKYPLCSIFNEIVPCRPHRIVSPLGRERPHRLVQIHRRHVSIKPLLQTTGAVPTSARRGRFYSGFEGRSSRPDRPSSHRLRRRGRGLCAFYDFGEVSGSRVCSNTFADGVVRLFLGSCVSLSTYLRGATLYQPIW